MSHRLYSFPDGKGLRTERMERADAVFHNHYFSGVDFIDETGVASKSYAKGRKGVRGVTLDQEGSYVGILTRIAGPDLSRRYKFSYFTSKGDELWSAFLCTGDDAAVPEIVQISEDGRIVLLQDPVPGESCLDGDSGAEYKAPLSCFGIRVFTSRGTTLFERQAARNAKLSPSGRYLVFQDISAARWSRVETSTGRDLAIPGDANGSPVLEIDDDGRVRYYNSHRNHRSDESLMEFDEAHGLHRVGRP